MTTSTANTPARRINPNGPIGSAQDLKAMLESQTANMAQVMPKHLTPERLIKVVLVAANRTPKILQCTSLSVIESVMRAAELGLECGTLGDAYLVPYGKTCQLIPGYKGLAKLARQSGEIRRIEAEVVCESDDFDYRKGQNFVLSFTPNLRGNRGVPIGAYALVEFKDGGIQADYMSFAEIEAIRNGSQGKNHGPWNDHWAEMARKTVFRRLAKWLPLSSEKYDKALELDNEDYRFVDTETGPSATGAAALNAAIDRAAEQATPHVDEPPTSETATWTDAVNALIARTGCDSDTAEEAIADAVAKQFKKDPGELTAEEVAETVVAVNDGKITIPPTN